MQVTRPIDKQFGSSGADVALPLQQKADGLHDLDSQTVDPDVADNPPPDEQHCDNPVGKQPVAIQLNKVLQVSPVA